MKRPFTKLRTQRTSLRCDYSVAMRRRMLIVSASLLLIIGSLVCLIQWGLVNCFLDYENDEQTGLEDKLLFDHWPRRSAPDVEIQGIKISQVNKQKRRDPPMSRTARKIHSQKDFANFQENGFIIKNLEFLKNNVQASDVKTYKFQDRHRQISNLSILDSKFNRRSVLNVEKVKQRNKNALSNSDYYFTFRSNSAFKLKRNVEIEMNGKLHISHENLINCDKLFPSDLKFRCIIEELEELVLTHRILSPRSLKQRVAGAMNSSSHPIIKYEPRFKYSRVNVQPNDSSLINIEEDFTYYSQSSFSSRSLLSESVSSDEALKPEIYKELAQSSISESSTKLHEQNTFNNDHVTKTSLTVFICPRPRHDVDNKIFKSKVHSSGNIFSVIETNRSAELPNRESSNEVTSLTMAEWVPVIRLLLKLLQFMDINEVFICTLGKKLSLIMQPKHIAPAAWIRNVRVYFILHYIKKHRQILFENEYRYDI